MTIPIEGIDFEKHSPFVQVIRVPLLRFFRFLPLSLSHKLFVNFSEDAKVAFRWAKTYKALEMMYTFPKRRAKGQISIADIFWQTFLSNARAVRNRLKLVEQILSSLIIERSERTNSVQILSIGSGSGRSIFEAIAALSAQVPFKATLLDNSQSALRFSQRLSKKIINDGQQNNFKWLCTKTEGLSDALAGFSSDIVEMVGLLDYFNDRNARDLFRLIYKHLSSGGWFMVSNVMPNIERPFVDRVVGWPLIYRQPDQLKDLLIKSGFNKDQIKLFIEPLKIYVVALCQKI